MKTKYFLFIFSIFVFLAFSCGKKGPQLPSNKTEGVKQKFELEELNKRLIERENSLIQQYIRESNESFQKDNRGFWYQIIDSVPLNEKINRDETIFISYRVYNLNNTLLEKDSINITVGKNEIIRGLDMGITLLNKGENAVFIFPWNLAYGILGNQINIPGYTSIRMEISTGTH